jgi:hypothetical protein
MQGVQRSRGDAPVVQNRLDNDNHSEKNHSHTRYDSAYEISGLCPRLRPWPGSPTDRKRGLIITGH